ncbi:hypothetical protein KS18_10270 [Photorhabdus luminescens]|nr:hypothetical protein KS18_10270 [Photorhabdus luminescens]
MADWQTDFDGRYPFVAGQNDASLPMLGQFIRADSGRIEQFLHSLAVVKHIFLVTFLDRLSIIMVNILTGLNPAMK